MTTESFRQLSAVAARQQGLVTGAQAARAGVEAAELSRLGAAGLVFELDWDVHQLASSPTAPRYAYPYAAWLALAPSYFVAERPAAREEDAVLSHGSAARLHGLSSVSTPSVTFIAPTDTPLDPDLLAHPRAVEIQVAQLAKHEITQQGGVAVTTPHRTLIDLVSSSTDHGELRAAMTDAVRRDLVDLADLYADLLPLAEQHEFPSDGPEFAGYFLPDLPTAELSPRNLRALTTVVLPARVAAVEQALAEALLVAPAGGRADRRTVRSLAAEIVGRTERV